MHDQLQIMVFTKLPRLPRAERKLQLCDSKCSGDTDHAVDASVMTYIVFSGISEGKYPKIAQTIAETRAGYFVLLGYVNALT